MKILNLKGRVLSAYVLCAYLIFLPGIVNKLSGFKLLSFKFGILILGSLCGMGLQKALSNMATNKEKMLFVLLVVVVVSTLAIGMSF